MLAAGSPPGGQASISQFSGIFAADARWHALRNLLCRRLQSGDAFKEEKIMDQSRLKVCYVITTRGDKKYWNRVGAAFLNNDGSINVKLESLPVAGELQIRDYVPREEHAGSSLRGKNGHGDDEVFAA
jgi:hypothetical protein